MLHVHHGSWASGTVESLLINLLLTRIMNEAKYVKQILYLKKKYRNFGGGNFSLTLSIYRLQALSEFTYFILPKHLLGKILAMIKLGSIYDMRIWVTTLNTNIVV